LTENQLAAAIITISAILGFIAIGLLASIIDIYAVRVALTWISVIGRFDNMVKGVFDIAAAVYFVSLAGIFVFLTVRVYENRRWK
jgi:ABC-2 type transport system permease protein